MKNDLCVGEVDCIANSPKQYEPLQERKLVRGAVVRDALGVFDKLHHEIWPTIRGCAIIGDLDDVWMVKGAEESRIRDCREAPIRFASYSIGFRGGHVQVRIERETEKELKAFFKEKALWSEERLSRLFSQLPFEPYAPVRRQFLVMLNQVNRIRKAAGLERIETSCLRLSRKPCRPFEKIPLQPHLSTVVGEATIGRSIGTYRKV